MKKNYLYNKTVIITGASGGIGFAIAKILIEKYDCKIIGIARNEQKMLDSIQTLGEKKTNFSYYLFDVSKKESWQDFYQKLHDNNIKIDILINNAGLMLPFKKFELISDDEVEEIVQTNFVANVYSVKTLLPLIKQSSSPAIINISSSAGLCAIVGQSMYCATKHAVHGFTQSLIQEYKGKIYIGGIYPGFVNTDILNRQPLDKKSKKLVNRFMMPLDKASKKIVKAISKKKKKYVLGFDGKFIGCFGRIFPKLTTSIITKVLKASKLEMFENTFDYKK